MASVVLLLGAGCGGFTSQQSISPLQFLIPGLSNTQPASAPTENTPSEKPAEPVKSVALAS